MVAAVALVLAVAMAAALDRVGSVAVDRTRARTAADAAALAGVRGGRAAAERLAGAHGGELVVWTVDDASSQVSVVVRVGSASAPAVASDRP